MKLITKLAVFTALVMPANLQAVTSSTCKQCMDPANNYWTSRSGAEECRSCIGAKFATAEMKRVIQDNYDAAIAKMQAEEAAAAAEPAAEAGGAAAAAKPQPEPAAGGAKVKPPVLPKPDLKKFQDLDKAVKKEYDETQRNLGIELKKLEDFFGEDSEVYNKFALKVDKLMQTSYSNLSSEAKIKQIRTMYALMDEISEAMDPAAGPAGPAPEPAAAGPAPEPAAAEPAPEPAAAEPAPEPAAAEPAPEPAAAEESPQKINKALRQAQALYNDQVTRLTGVAEGYRGLGGKDYSRISKLIKDNEVKVIETNADIVARKAKIAEYRAAIEALKTIE